MKPFISTLSLTSLAFLVTACGVTKTMDDMNASTSKMSATTDIMSATTSKMSRTTEGLAGDTKLTAKEVAFSYVDARTASTRESRQQTFTGLLQATGSSAKLDFASEYFASMEYQFWKPYTEATSSRDNLKAIAVNDFFAKTKDLIKDVKYNLGTMDADLKDPNYLTLCSLAATLQFVNTAQLDTITQSPTTQMTSMLSMIEEGLASKDDMNNNRIDANSIPKYQVVVQENAEDARFILKLRQNYLKAMALELSSQKDSGEDGNDSFVATKTALGCLGAAATDEDKAKCAKPTQWSSDFAARNVSQITFIATVLEFANDTQAFLKKQNIDSPSDVGVATLLGLMKIDLGQTPLPAILAAADRVSKARDAAIAK